MKNITTTNLFFLAIWALFLASCGSDELVLEHPEIIFPDPMQSIKSSVKYEV